MCVCVCVYVSAEYQRQKYAGRAVAHIYDGAVKETGSCLHTHTHTHILGPNTVLRLSATSARTMDAVMGPMEGAKYWMKANGVRQWWIRIPMGWAVFNVNRKGQALGMAMDPGFISNPTSAEQWVLDVEAMANGELVLIDVLRWGDGVVADTNRGISHTIEACKKLGNSLPGTPGLRMWGDNPNPSLIVREYYSIFDEAYKELSEWGCDADGIIAATSGAVQYRMKQLPTVELIVKQRSNGMVCITQEESIEPLAMAPPNAEPDTVYEFGVTTDDGNVVMVPLYPRPDKDSANPSSMVEMVKLVALQQDTSSMTAMTHLTLVSNTARQLVYSSLLENTTSSSCIIDVGVHELECMRYYVHGLSATISGVAVLLVEPNEEALDRGLARMQPGNTRVVKIKSPTEIMAWINAVSNMRGARYGAIACELQSIIPYLRRNLTVSIMAAFSIQFCYPALREFNFKAIYGVCHTYDSIGEGEYLINDPSVTMGPVSGNMVQIRLRDHQYEEPKVTSILLRLSLPNSHEVTRYAHELTGTSPSLRRMFNNMYVIRPSVPRSGNARS